MTRRYTVMSTCASNRMAISPPGSTQLPRRRPVFSFSLPLLASRNDRGAPTPMSRRPSKKNEKKKNLDIHENACFN